MAKKKKSFSHIEAQDALENHSNIQCPGEELVYKILEVFCGYGPGELRRIRENVGKPWIDECTLIVSNTIAYKVKGLLDFHDEIKSM